jgi:hypothetical protein
VGLRRGREDLRPLRARPEAGSAGLTVILLVADGRLGYRVLRCVAAVAGRVIVLGSIGESPWKTEGWQVAVLHDLRYAPAGFQDCGPSTSINRLVADHPRRWWSPPTCRAVVSGEVPEQPCRSGPGPVSDPQALRSWPARTISPACARSLGFPIQRTTVAADLDELRRLLQAKPFTKAFMLKPVDHDGGWRVRRLQLPKRDGWTFLRADPRPGLRGG